MKRICSLVLAVCMIAILSGCQETPTAEPERLFSANDLEGCTLTCNGEEVEDTDFTAQVIDLCLTAEPFRPIFLGFDMKLGHSLGKYFCLTKESTRYMFIFTDLDEQMDIGFPHREKPSIWIMKRELESGEEEVQEWFYTMTAANYATLYDMVSSYDAEKTALIRARYAPAEQEEFLTRKDLAGRTLYIHNDGHSDDTKVWPVREAEFVEQVVQFCLTAELFRPRIPLVDPDPPRIGESHLILQGENDRYLISFYDAHQQFDIKFLYREEPLITIRKATENEAGEYQVDWAWECVVPVADYAEICKITQMYAKGEVIDFDWL